jgi:hypothetical protein
MVLLEGWTTSGALIGGVLGSTRPAKVAHGPALGNGSPPGDLRLSC